MEQPNKQDNVLTGAEDELRSLIERVERLEEEKKAIADDVKEVFGEAKGRGFDIKAMKTVIKERKIEAAEREERDAMVHLYMSAMGMISN